MLLPEVFNTATLNAFFFIPPITDVQGGFSVSGESEEGPREGKDYHLSCIANKHLYSNMSWHRVTESSAGTVEGPPLVGELAEGEYSLALHLTLTNLTAQDSGTYRCSATHLYTGQHSDRDALVSVAGVCHVAYPGKQIPESSFLMSSSALKLTSQQLLK